MTFKDKVAIITGSSRGIGAATAKLFAERGAKVVIHYQKEKAKAEKIASEIGLNKCLLFGGDLTDEDTVKKLATTTKDHFGRIDILINNAGAILRPGDWQSELETWKKTIDINLTSAWLMTKAVAPIMQKQKQGSIVNLVSTVGIIGSPFVVPYGAAKGGLINLTKSMAKALAPHIRVNGVAPSNVMTDMTKAAGEELIEKFRQTTLLERIAEPEELAKAIAFLASDEASYITAEILVVDGGYSLK